MTANALSRTLGIDFGTSNSAAGVLVNGRPFLIEVEQGRKTLPTSVFFDFDRRRTLFGTEANRALIEGRDGRFMRSLKSVLGTPLLHEKRGIMGQQRSVGDIIAGFLRHIKTRAEQVCYTKFDRALSGRPVHFHSNNPERDAQALKDLRGCYLQAGFSDVAFLAEPEAAALATGGEPKDGRLSLIVDIGGGTSDFTVYRMGDDGIDILASHGLRVGGTNFDRSISVDHVMPLFGKNSEIGQVLGDNSMRAPNRIFYDLSTWQMIPFLYTPDILRDVREMEKLALEPHKFRRLAAILDHHLGHDVAFAVEAGKIAVNTGEAAKGVIDLSIVERGLSIALNRAGVSTSLIPHIAQIRDGVGETLGLAGCAVEDIGAVVFVGGSSMMHDVEGLLGAMFPHAEMQSKDVFTGVVDGLAIAAGES